MQRFFLGALSLYCYIQLGYASYQSGIDRLINQVSPNMNIGIQVVDLSTGSTLYQRNQNQLFTPASNMKLFSDAAALMILGPDYRFRNQLSIGLSELNNGVFNGNLYLQLPGDPSFNNERLASLLTSLKDLHIRQIHGNVIIDSDHAAIDPYPPGGWTAKDLIYSYGAPLAPVIIDMNRVLVTVNPSGIVNSPAVIEVKPIDGLFNLNNQVNTSKKNSRSGVSFVLDRDNNLTVRGSVAAGQWSVQEFMAIRNPHVYAQALIKHLLVSNNIILNGKVVFGKTPQNSLLLATDYSKPIAQLMADTLKPSDNLYADSLFLHAAAKLNGAPVNWPDAQRLIKQFLQRQTGIPLDNAALTDGSGLSRHDLLSPFQTVSLLRFLYERFPLTYEYIAALPISGRDGTLQRRFKQPGQKDLVRAKTGTMTGVVSLSGYLYTLNSHTVAFAIFINNLPHTKPAISGRSRYLIDSICTYLLQQKPGNQVWSKLFSRNTQIKYQQNPTQAEIKRHYQANWRRLETVIKQALAGQAVTVIFRGNEIILQDNQTNVHKVFAALRALRNKYQFAIAVTAAEKPILDGKPVVMWIRQTLPQSRDIKRLWMIKLNHA